MSWFTDNPFMSTAWRYLVYPQMWTRQTPDWTGLTWWRCSAPCRWVEMMDSDVISLLYTAASKHGPAQRSAARLTVPLTAYRDYVKSQLGYFMMTGLNSFSLPHQMWSQLYVITNKYKPLPRTLTPSWPGPSPAAPRSPPTFIFPHH